MPIDPVQVTEPVAPECIELTIGDLGIAQRYNFAQHSQSGLRRNIQKYKEFSGHNSATFLKVTSDGDVLPRDWVRGWCLRFPNGGARGW
jgi:hypothetical protein